MADVSSSDESAYKQPSRTAIPGPEELRRIPFEDLKKGIAQTIEQREALLRKGVAEGKVIFARYSSDPAHVALQRAIDEMVATNQHLFPASYATRKPDLYIHVQPLEGLNALGGGGSAHIGAMMTAPHYIETSQQCIDWCAKKDPKMISALFAHELGHTCNGDNSIEGIARMAISEPSHQIEINANRKGALIFGNARKFAELMGFVEQAPGSPTHPSTSQLKRHLNEWANYLEKAGATNANGTIADMDKALAAFHETKAMQRLGTDPRLLAAGLAIGAVGLWALLKSDKKAHAATQTNGEKTAFQNPVSSLGTITTPNTRTENWAATVAAPAHDPAMQTR